MDLIALTLEQALQKAAAQNIKLEVNYIERDDESVLANRLRVVKQETKNGVIVLYLMQQA